jgi:3-hydroxyisobutyrate dehydrogenase
MCSARLDGTVPQSGGSSLLPSIGILGAGTMGGAICGRLTTAGYAVYVFDSQASALEAAAKQGASVAASANELAAACDIILVLVSTDAQVLDAISEGFADALRTGSLVVLHSTVHPDTCHHCENALLQHGVRLIDAAMSGGRSGVEAGALLLMVGGDLTTLSEATAFFQAYAGRVIHMGPLGSGMTAKLCSNVVLHANRMALYEGVRLAATLGLDPRVFVEAVDSGAASSWISGHWLEADYMVLGEGLGNHQVVAQMEKDLAHATQLATEAGGTFEFLELVLAKLPELARFGLQLG